MGQPSPSGNAILALLGDDTYWKEQSPTHDGSQRACSGLGSRCAIALSACALEAAIVGHCDRGRSIGRWLRGGSKSWCMNFPVGISPNPANRVSDGWIVCGGGGSGDPLGSSCEWLVISWSVEVRVE